jgi:orotidine-5'-phosphate decarboxylase
LAATSNPEGRQLQRARQENGERVEDAVLATVASWNEQEEGRGSMGVVLGATRERPSFDLAQVRGPFLVPGVGAQGAGPHDVARLFLGVMPHSVVVNVSRALTAAGPESRAIRDAARRWRDDLRDALG